MSDDLGKQVELQAQLNSLLEKRIKLQNQLNSACGQQCGYAEEMNNAAKEGASNTQQQTANINEQRQAQEKAAKSAGSFFSQITTGQAAAAGGTVGLIQGFKDMGISMSGIGGLLKSFTGGLFSIGKAILAIPFSLFGGLISMANNAAQAGTQLRQAFEDVRKEFGALDSGPGKNIVEGFRDMSSSAGNLAGTGLSVSRVFGYGPDGMAKMMGAVSDIAKGLGPAINLLGDEFGKSAEQAVMFSKGLGLSGEQMGKLMKDAALSGKSQSDMMTEVGSMSLQMASKFGLSAKDIGKDIADMTGDFATFGNMSVKEMGAASAFARKLGMDMKDLKGVVDKFDDFEGAADSVSQLNQAFGMQIDTMKMMNAENPAERIDMLRESFFAAGKSIENMTRQEKKLLMAQTGLTESALKNAFAAENQGLSYEDFADAAGDAEENQLSQEEVMLKLAKAIEKIAEAGQSFSGIGDAFGKGFMHAMSKDKDMRELMVTIRAFLKEVFHFGQMVGKVFMDLMRSTGLFANLKDLFNPADFRKLFKALKEPIEEFAKYLITGKGNPEEILKKFSDILMNFFGSKKGALSGIGEALKRMAVMLGKAFGAIIGFIWSQVKDPLMDLLGKIPGLLAEFAANNIGLVSMIIGGWLAMAFTKALAGAAMGAAAKKVLEWMSGKVEEAAPSGTPDTPKMTDENVESISGIKKIAEALKEINLKDVGKAAVALVILGTGFAASMYVFAQGIKLSYDVLKDVPAKGLLKVFAAVALSILAMIPFVAAALLMEPTTLAIAGLMMLGGAVFFAVSVIAFAAGLRAAYEIMKPMDFKGVAKTLGMVAIAVGATAALIAAGAALIAVSPIMIPAGLGLVAGAVFFTVGVLAYSKAIQEIDGVTKSIQWKKFASTLAGVAVAIVATGALLGAGAILFLASFGGFGAAGRGLEKAAEFFVTGVLAYSEAINQIHGRAKSINWKKFGSTLAGVGIAVAATGALFIAGSLGALAGFGFVLAAAGLRMAAEFFITGVSIFGDAIQKIMPQFKSLYQNRKAAEFGLEAIGKTIKAIGGLSKVGAVFGVLSSLFGGGFSKGVIAAGIFFEKSVPVLSQLISTIAGIKVTDPKVVKLKMEIVAGAIAAMQSLAGMGIEAAKMALVSKLLGGGSMTDIMHSMSVFIVSVGSSLTTVINSLVKLAEGITSKEQGEKVKIVTAAVAAVADLAQAMFEPLKIAGEMGSSMFGPSFSETMTLITKGIKDIMCGMMDHLPTLVKKITDSARVIKNPKTLKPKMEVVSLAMKAVSNFAKSLGAIMKLMPKKGGFMGIGGKSDEERVAELVKNVAGIVGAVKAHMGTLVDAITGIHVPNPERALKIVSVVEKSVSAAQKFVEIIEGVGHINGEAINNMASGLVMGVANSLVHHVNWDFNNLFKSLEALNLNEASLEKFNVASKAVVQMVNFTNSVGKLLIDGQQLVAASDTYKAAYFGSEGVVANAVSGMVEAYNTTYNALKGIENNPMDLKVRLQTFAETLGLDKETFTIQNEQLNFTVNVNVQLDAEKMVDTLSDKSTMGRRTVQVVGAG